MTDKCKGSALVIASSQPIHLSLTVIHSPCALRGQWAKITFLKLLLFKENIKLDALISTLPHMSLDIRHVLKDSQYRWQLILIVFLNFGKTELRGLKLYLEPKPTRSSALLLLFFAFSYISPVKRKKHYIF